MSALTESIERLIIEYKQRHAQEIADCNAAIAKLQRTIERARKAADMGHLLTVQRILEGKE